jgi:hypothetical protein
LWFGVAFFFVIVNVKKPCRNANHPGSSRPAFIEKGSSTLKKDFSRNATFWIVGRQFVPAGRKKKRSIEVSSGEKKAGSRLRSHH